MDFIYNNLEFTFIPGYNCHYGITTSGIICRYLDGYFTTYRGKHVFRAYSKRILTHTKLSLKGYPRVNLNGDYFFIHQLVALTFIKNSKNKPQINHIDGNKLNNSVTNLEWCTNQENRDHAVALGLQTSRLNGNYKYSIDQIKQLELLVIKEGTQRKAAKLMGINERTASKLLLWIKNARLRGTNLAM